MSTLDWLAASRASAAAWENPRQGTSVARASGLPASAHAGGAAQGAPPAGAQTSVPAWLAASRASAAAWATPRQGATAAAASGLATSTHACRTGQGAPSGSAQAPGPPAMFRRPLAQVNRGTRALTAAPPRPRYVTVQGAHPPSVRCSQRAPLARRIARLLCPDTARRA